jgi:hypothetical protein
MKTYIVRIYHFEKDNPRRFVGTVEEAGNEEKRAFSYFDELWDILSAPKGGFKGERMAGTEENNAANHGG